MKQAAFAALWLMLVVECVYVVSARLKFMRWGEGANTGVEKWKLCEAEQLARHAGD
jgi:hypothetical protein